MINEEIANRVVNIEINVLKATYQEILNNGAFENAFNSTTIKTIWRLRKIS